MKKYLFFSLLVSLPVWATPQMHLSSSSLQIGEPMQIVFEDTQSIGQLPDLGSLQDHFVIRGQQSAFNTSIVNGVQSQSYRLILSVFPKEVGTFSVGPFEVNQTVIPPQTVQIYEQNRMPSSADVSSLDQTTQSGTDHQSEGLFQVDAQITPTEIYMGETALYTVHFVENIGLTQVQIQMPEEKTFTLSPFGQDKMGRTLMNNQPVHFFERSFLLTPQTEGTIEISPAGVIGRVPDKNAAVSRHNFPDIFEQDPFFESVFGLPQKEVYRQSKPVRLVVLPKPADWKGWWLPSQEVRLEETYQMPSVVKIGQPIERRVRLQAAGVEGHQLPLLVQPAGRGLKVYANPDQRGQMTTSTGLMGYEEMTFILVPTETGQVTIPAIRVFWFNTKEKKAQTAILPERKISVEGDSEPPVSMPTNQLNTPSQTNPDPIVQSAEAVDSQKPILKNDFKKESLLLKIGLVGGGVLVVLMGIGLWLIIRYRHRRRFVRLDADQQNSSRKRSRKKPLPDLYPF